MHADLQTGLAAYWSFDEGLADPIGGLHVRPDQGQATFSEGKLGRSLVLGERHPVLRTIDTLTAGLEADGDFSMAAWVRANSFSREGDGDLISRGGENGWGLAYLHRERGLTNVVRASGSFENNTQFSKEGADDQWRLLVAVQKTAEKTMSVYVDNVMIREANDLTLSGAGDTRVVFGNNEATSGLRGGTRSRWEGLLDEVAIWQKALPEEEIAELYQNGKGLSLAGILQDDDADGLPAVWEHRYQLDDSVDNREEDPDGDGLSNAQELILGTDPTSADTDSEGLIDKVETGSGIYVGPNNTGSHPLAADTDRDGLSDGRELMEGTDPTKADTDGDSFSDWHELDIGLDPLIAEPDPSVTGFAPTLAKGLLAHWDFNGDLEDHAGDFDGGLSDKISFVTGKFDQGIQFEPLSQVDILDQANEAFEFKRKSFSIALWIEAQGAGPFALNPLIQYKGAKTWYVLLHQQFDEDAERSTQNLFLNPGVSLPGSFIIDGLFEQDPDFIPPFPRLPTEPLYGGSRHHFPRDTMSHIVVIYDVTANQTFNYVNGELRSWQGESGPDVSRHIEPGLRLRNLSWRMRLDDLAIWERALAPVEIGALYADGQGKSLAELLSGDKDNDGMPDDWEREHALDLTIDDSALDPDSDGLSNLGEFVRRTNPRDPDGDQDGALDGVETGTGVWKDASDRGTDPFNPDSDDDGLLDGVENVELVFVDSTQTGTDPNQRDSDGDQFEDGEEVDAGADPTSVESTITLSNGLVSYWPLDGGGDDKVGLANGAMIGNPSFVKAEHREGILLDGLTQHIEIDANIDGLEFTGSQHFTVSVWVRADTHPISPEKPVFPTIIGASGWMLGMENDFGIARGGIALIPTNASFPSPLTTQRIYDREIHHIVGVSEGNRGLVRLYLDGTLIPPPKPNGDSIIGDTWRPSRTEVPLTIGKEPTLGWDNHWSGIIDDLAIWKRALKGFEVTEVYESHQSLGAMIEPKDSDEDGLEDSWEERYGLALHSNDASEDPDADGLSNLTEFERGTDPRNPDSDGDGLVDGVETGTGVWQSDASVGTYPNRVDSDLDGLIDGMEHPDPAVAGMGKASDPNLPDSDGDGAGDLAESTAHSDPLDPGSLPGAHWNVRVVETNRPITSLDRAVELLNSHDPALLKSAWNEPVIDWVTELFGTEVLRDSSVQGVFESDDIYFPHVRVPSTKERFALQADGVLSIRTPGIYTFAMRSYRGLLLVDGEEIKPLDSDGPRQKARLFPVRLEAGSHQVQVVTYGSNSSDIFELGFTGVPGVDQVLDGTFELLTVADPNLVLLDSDRDGLLDATEFSFFPGDLDQLSGDGDWDQDGLSDGSELSKGTNPISAANSLITLFTFDGKTPFSNSAYRGEDAIAFAENDGSIDLEAEPLVAGKAVGFDSARIRQTALLEASVASLTDFTLSLWFNADDPDGPAQVLAARGADLDAAPQLLFLANSAVYWQGKSIDGDDEIVIASTPIEVGKTYHVTVVHQSSPLRTLLYVDGQQSAESTWSDDAQWMDSDEPLLIGGIPQRNGFNGTMDQFAIYKRALEPDEILKLHQNPTETINDVETAIGAHSFRILAVNASLGERELRWESIPNRRYRVEYSPSMESGSFQTLVELVAVGTTSVFTDDEVTRLVKQGYYRIARLDE